MEVEYELTHDDLFAFQWRAAFTSRRARRARYTAYVIWFLALLLMASVPAIGADGFMISRMSFSFLLIGFPIVALAQWGLERWLMGRAIRGLLREENPGGGLLGKHRVAVNSEGIVDSTPVGESRTSWTGVHRIEEDPGYIFVYTSAVGAHVLPKRAFGDPHKAERFIQLCRAGKEGVG